MTSRGTKGRKRRAPHIARGPRQVLLRETISDLTPPIWRSVRVPDEFTLHRLHRVLQISFSRLDYHLYEFVKGERRFRRPHPTAEEEHKDSTAITLGDLDLQIGSALTYVYDFGDDWVHDIVVEQFLPMPDGRTGNWSPRLIDGARAAPPEDAGGPPGYERLIAALRDPKHSEHKECRDWAGGLYDPDRFDPWAVDHALALAVAWGAI